MKLHIDPVDGPTPPTARQAAIDAKIPERALDGTADILVKLYRCFTEGDCDLAEINPLILSRPVRCTPSTRRSASTTTLLPSPGWEEYRRTEELDEREQLARTHDLQYIGLDGTVGIIANGAAWR